MEDKKEKVHHITILLDYEGLDRIIKNPDRFVTLANYCEAGFSGMLFIAEMNCKLATKNKIQFLFNKTGAIALHEEATNTIYVAEDQVDTINDEYGWVGAGNIFCSDMLTTAERFSVIIKEIEKDGKPLQGVKEIFKRLLLVQTDTNKMKTTTKLKDDVTLLFSNGSLSVEYDDKVISMPSLLYNWVEDKNFFLCAEGEVVVEDKKEPVVFLPAPIEVLEDKSDMIEKLFPITECNGLKNPKQGRLF